VKARQAKTHVEYLERRGGGSAYHEQELAAARVKVDEAQARVARAAKMLAPYDAEFVSRGRWSRYFLVVTNGTGHIHSSMNCSSCRPTTQYAWQPHMSGSSEAAAVGEYGSDMCTVCFPSAPTDPAYHQGSWTGKQKAAAAEVKAQEKTAKAAAAAAKGVTGADGGPLRVREPGSSYVAEVKTERAAEIRYVDMMAAMRTKYVPERVAEAEAALVARIAAKESAGEDASWDRKVLDRHRTEVVDAHAGVEALADALARKRGVTVGEVAAALEQKIAKKAAKDYGHYLD
jgi:hypothetical protein